MESAGGPEREALLAVARGDWAVPRDVSWPRLLDLAHEHGLLPLLAASAAVDTMPADVRRVLARRAVVESARSQGAVRELARIVGRFRAADLPLLTWKGPVLADVLYGSPSLRTFTDLDLIVAPARVERAEELLAELGYRPHVALTPSQARALRRLHVERVFVGPPGPDVLDLHWHFSGAQFPFPLAFADAWDRHVERAIGVVRLPTLATEDAVIAAAAHAAKHLWDRLEALAGIARLARFADVDWEEVDARAGTLHVARQLGASFRLAERVLGARPPPVPRALRAADRVSPRLYAFVEANLFQARRHRNGAGLRELAFLADRKLDVARAAASVLRPTMADWAGTDRPSWAYWLLRPARLVVKHTVLRLRGRRS